MEFTTYILFSKDANKFYTGFTSLNIDERLRRHLSDHKGFTGNAKDWTVVFLQSFQLKKEALQLERKIKKRGAKRFLKDGDLNYS